MIGTGRGVGTTHFSIMTANYISGALRRKTAVLEWNRHGDFARMEKVCAGTSRAEKPFRALDADYYKSAGMGELLLCRKKGIQDVILDFGTVREEGFQEFLRCGRRFVLAGLSEWQIGEFLEFAGSKDCADREFEFLAAFGGGPAKREWRHLPDAPIKRIPFSEDAFAVGHELMTFYERLL